MLFPNPASQEINFKWNTALEERIVIYSLEGRKLKEQPIYEYDRQAKIDISDFSPGVYLAKIGNYSAKFVVK